MNQPDASLVELLHNAQYLAKFSALILVSGSLIGYLFYFGVIQVITGRSTKYRFRAKNEINVLWTASLGIVVAGSIFISAILIKDRDLTNALALSMKLILPLGFGFLVGSAINTYLRIYYPSILEDKLAKIRFKQRKSPHNGQPMRLLNEEEEDAYLTREMIHEEELNHFDYDVWLDEATKVTIIEKYVGNPNKLCPSCKFQTLRLESEEEEGNHTTQKYRCTYCGNKETEVIENN
ncbi:hypothetical protein N7E81_03200 [Reichenbachiella carrageenanivorans]|uniref:Uncharacterized protein n=1 Tax=Reichenbachiella carrageenanivorans TaxID=2979869 RepID=A0ABY6D1T1_9BACT|nr:hypothetical protein [Reichenbachiella carrageenanivorans]UXX80111.1 hypothetical protein N7E81_03200 [Reichenbachiella carrageenanivorans]